MLYRSGKLLVILLLTYNRMDYARTTIESVLAQLKTDVPLHVHIADDGSPEDYLDTLACFAAKSGVPVTVSNSEHRGYGANYNLALQTVHNLPGVRYVLCLEDDWELLRPLYLSSIFNLLEEKHAGCVRLGYIGYTQALKATFMAHGGQHWLKLDPDSPEPHVFAGHPRIETVEWQKRVGPWPEGLQPGATEFAVTHIREAREDVVWPISLIGPSGGLFAHIGTIRSY